MPYFYKLSDFKDQYNNNNMNYNNNNNNNYNYNALYNKTLNQELLNIVQFTIANLITGCESRFGEGSSVKIFIFNLENTDVYKHPRNNYEYITQNSIEPVRIIDISEFSINENNIQTNNGINFYLDQEMFEIFINYIKDAINYDRRNNFYLHISCTQYEQSIIQHGLLGENILPNNMRIGNRQNGGSKRKAPKEHAKEFKLDTIKKGLDGKKWIVKKRIDGVKIWKKYTK
jgi:hypothetical protein